MKENMKVIPDETNEDQELKADELTAVAGGGLLDDLKEKKDEVNSERAVTEIPDFTKGGTS